MITIALLKDHPNCLLRCSEIWYEVLGKTWIPEITLEQAVEHFKSHLNSDILPITLVALCEDKPVGMCSLCESDGLAHNLTPWLCSLVVDSKYQNKGIGMRLIVETKNKAIELGYKNLYLFAFDRTIPEYYKRFGWTVIANDILKVHPITIMACELDTQTIHI